MEKIKLLLFISLMFLFHINISLSSSKCYDKIIFERKVEIFKSPLERNIDSLTKELVSDSIDVSRYLDILSYNESRGNYGIVNKYGYLGKYQFSKNTLNLLLKENFIHKDFDLSKDHFLSDSLLQEYAVLALIKANFQTLNRNKSYDYIGEKVGGVDITIEGLLAAAHLRGPRAVKLFLKSNGRINLTDANGTSVKDYIDSMS